MSTCSQSKVEQWRQFYTCFIQFKFIHAKMSLYSTKIWSKSNVRIKLSVPIFDQWPNSSVFWLKKKKKKRYKLSGNAFMRCNTHYRYVLLLPQDTRTLPHFWWSNMVCFPTIKTRWDSTWREKMGTLYWHQHHFYLLSLVTGTVQGPLMKAVTRKEALWDKISPTVWLLVWCYTAKYEKMNDAFNPEFML